MSSRPLLWTIRFASALGFTALSLTGEISAPYIVACWAAWTASFYLDRQPRWQERLRAWETAAVLMLISIFALDFYVWGYTLFVAVAHFLMLFQVFKLLGLKSRKDCLQILIFSFFQMLSACTLSVDAWQAIILFLLIPTATAGLFWQQISREADLSGVPPPAAAHAPYRRLVTLMCLSTIPVNIVLAAAMFMIFPRLAFRGAFAGYGTGRSGYSEQVNLSQAGVVGLDNSAVLWLQISPPQDRTRWKGYLRGGTLDSFNGKRWSRSGTTVSQTLYADTNGLFKLTLPDRRVRRGLRQTVILVNTAGTTLFGSPYIGELVAPLSTLQSLADGSVRWTSGWRKPLRYDVISFDQPPAGRTGPLNASSLKTYLQLPEMPLQRVEALTRQIARRGSPRAQAQAIETYLHDNFQYSLDLGNGAAANPVEEFLFNRKRGPCGHFASAMALMLRLKGIPSRVVAGYFKGTWNARVQQFLIRERDAHAWVEAYFPETGWVSFDPSPRVFTAPKTQLWMLRFQENWEYVNYRWDHFVIQYGLYSQIKVVEDIQSNTNRINARIGGWVDRNLMGFERPGREVDEGKFPPWLWKAGLGLVLVLGVWAVRTLRQARSQTDPEVASYHRFLRQMARKGWPKGPAETAWEYAERLQSRAGSLPIEEITRRYYLTRFAGNNRIQK